MLLITVFVYELCKNEKIKFFNMFLDKRMISEFSRNHPFEILSRYIIIIDFTN